MGLAFTASARQQLARLENTYTGKNVALTAEVEQVSASYLPYAVRAVLRVKTVDGQSPETTLRVACSDLPECDAGDEVLGCFRLEAVQEEQQLSRYADGIALEGEYRFGFRLLGRGASFRARTHRLQKKLSEGLRSAVPEPLADTGGVLAAMVVGDRSALSADLRDAYRAAGLSHIFVVSGMHVSILCGLMGGLTLPEKPQKRRVRSHWSRKAEALFRAVLALLLVGVTGFTPSVQRAAAAVWVSALGVWLFAPADALTSLGIAGVLMTCTNSYAVCDVGFELSFAAVLGTLAGGAVFHRLRSSAAADRKKPKRISRARRIFKKLGWTAAESFCIALCASAATFPVLVLRGMSASLWALLSSVAVLWLAQPILLFGLGAAVLSLIPAARPLTRLCGLLASLPAEVLNRWAVLVSGWPGAQLYFETACAAVVCLLLLFLGWLAYRWKVRFRVAVPVLLIVVVVSVTAGNFLSRDVVRVELTGSKNNPAVVITQSDTAVVLYRGGDPEAVETVLAKRGIRCPELVIDLRMNPEAPCALSAKTKLAAAPLPRQFRQRFRCGREGQLDVELLRTGEGCLVRVRAAGRSLASLSGSVRLAKPLSADWLLASPARPYSVHYTHLLTSSTNYRWMQEEAENWKPAEALLLRPGGGYLLR